MFSDVRLFVIFFVSFFLLTGQQLLHGQSANRADDAIRTINYQGVLRNEDNSSLVNGTFSMHFYIHTITEQPPFFPDERRFIWDEYYERVMVKDGLFFQRLGVFNPLSSDIFRRDTALQMSILIVPYGTAVQSWFGPMAIDGNAYSVSSVGIRGEDAKEGTLTIIPSHNSQDNYQALLELKDNQNRISTANNKYKLHIVLDPYLNPFENHSSTTAGLRIKYPQKVDGIDFYATDIYPTALSTIIPYSNQTFFTAGVTVPDLALYIANGTIRMEGKLSIAPLNVQLNNVMPGNLEADRANVTGDIKVNEVRTEGIIRGAKLEYCFAERPDCGIDLPRSLNPYVDHVIDPWPTASSSGTKINALQISGQSFQRGELRVLGPQETKATSYVEVGSGEVITPALFSPFPSTDPNLRYELQPDGMSTIDSVLFLTLLENSSNLESTTEDRATRSLLDPYSMFNLISAAPYCIRNGQAHMALREDYCLPSPRNAYRDESSTDPDDKYYGVDPCQGVLNSDLYGLPSECFVDHEVPARYVHANVNPKGSIYIIHNHTHRIVENATAEMLIDIINRASSHVYLRKHVLPVDAVDLTQPATLFGVNLFSDIYARGAVTAHKGSLNIYLAGSDNPSAEGRSYITLGTERTDIDAVYLVNDYYNDERYIDLYAKSGSFASASFGESAHVAGNTVVYKPPESAGHHGNFNYLSMSPGHKSTQYFYMPNNLVIRGSLYFFDQTPVDQRVLSGFSYTAAGSYIDAYNPSFMVSPNQLSKLHTLEVFGQMTLEKKADILGDVLIGNTQGGLHGLLHAYNNLRIEDELSVETLADLNNPDYYVHPIGTSHILNLDIIKELEVDGELVADGDLLIGNALTVGGNFLLEKNLIPATNANITVKAKAIQYPYGNYLVDPSNYSRLHDLELFGTLTVHGDVSLSGSILHVGHGVFDHEIWAKNRFLSHRLYDHDDFSYYLDPSSQSRLSSLTITDQVSNANFTKVYDNMFIGRDLLGNDSLEVIDKTTVANDLIFRQGISLVPEGLEQPVFRVDQDGSVYASSFAIDRDIFVADMIIGGDLIVFGPVVEINADTAMDDLSIATHALNLQRGFMSTYTETAVLFDADGNLFSAADIDYAQQLSFGQGISFVDDTDAIRLISPAGGPDTIKIGATAHKNLRLSGLTAQSLTVNTAEFSLFVDQDTISELEIEHLEPLQPYAIISSDSHRFIDPNSFAILESLYIRSSWQAAEGITAPHFLDTDNLYRVDPDQESRLQALEQLSYTTAEHWHSAFIHLDTEHQNAHTPIIKMGKFDHEVLSVVKNEAVTIHAITTISDSFLHIKNNDGLHLADDFSVGSGILLTPGDLSTLRHYKNADYLHRHEMLGGVASYNFARRDIDNMIPASEATSKEQSWLRAFHGHNYFTADGTVIALRPELHNDIYPLLAVLPYTGAIPFSDYILEEPVFSVLPSGVVSATLFSGDGSLVSNISGHGTSYAAIIEASIGSEKIVSFSLFAHLFQTDILESRHIADHSLQGYHIQANAIENRHIRPSQITSALIADAVVESAFIQDGEIDHSRIAPKAISTHHIMTATISGEKIAVDALKGEHFAPQSISSSKIISSSLVYRHVSTGAADSLKIYDLSLTGREFAADIITPEKIQDYAVITSHFHEKTLTDSDFATASVTAINIDTESIIGENFVTDSIESDSLAPDSIDYTKFLAGSILNIDIKTDAIGSNSIATLSKLAALAVTSGKIDEKVIIGEFFFPENVLLSHVQEETVSSVHFDLSSIHNIDIKDLTLTGVKIQKQSILTTQIADNAVLAAKIADKTFDHNSITANTLTSLSFADAAITLDKVAYNTVLSTHFADFTLLDEDFAENALIRSKWQTDTIENIKISPEAVTNVKLATNAISNNKILAANITTAAIGSYQIQSQHIVDGQLLTAKFAPETLQTIDFSDAIFDNRIIAADTIYSTNIIDLSIVSSLVPTEILTAGQLDNEAVISDKIRSAQLSTGKFQPLTLTSFHFAADSIESHHIDTESVSERVIGTRQILTTHIIAQAVRNEHIAEKVLDARVVHTDAIISQHIITHSLIASNFATNQLTDAHFAAQAILLEHIVDLSIVDDRWLAHSLTEDHVKPSSLTSHSLADENITSSKIALANVSGQHLALFTITDRELSPSVLKRSVLGPDSIDSSNIRDYDSDGGGLEAADFAEGAVHSWHIVPEVVVSDHFAEKSILTTHFADFSITADLVQEKQIAAEKIAEKSSASRGFSSLANAFPLTSSETKIKIGFGRHGELLLLSAGEDSGLYYMDNLESGVIQKRHNFTGETLGKSLSRGQKSWFVVDNKNLYYSDQKAQNFFLLHSFAKNIQDFYFEDELHGVLATSDSIWYTKDGGFSFRLLHNTEKQPFRVFSLDELELVWAAVKSDNNVIIYHFSDWDELTLQTHTVSSCTAPTDNIFAFWMYDEENGFVLSSSELYTTTDNWANTTSSSFDVAEAFQALANDDIAILVYNNGKVSRKPKEGGWIHNKLFPWTSPIEVLDIALDGSNSWYLLYRLFEEDSIFLAHTTDTGDTYKVQSLGTADRALRQSGRLSATNNYISLGRGQQLFTMGLADHVWESLDLVNFTYYVSDFVCYENAYYAIADTNDGYQLLHSTNGNNWTSKRELGNKQALLSMSNNNSGFIAILGNNGEEDIISGTDSFASVGSISSNINIKTLKSIASGAVLAGDEGQYALLQTPANPVLRSAVLTSDINLTAVDSDKNGGYWFGTDDGQVLHITAFDAPYTGETIINLPALTGTGSQFLSDELADGTLDSPAWKFQAIDDEVYIDFSSYNRQLVNLLRIYALNTDDTGRLEISASHDSFVFTTLAADLSVSTVGWNSFYVAPEMPFRIYRLRISTAFASSLAIGELELYSEAFVRADSFGKKIDDICALDQQTAVIAGDGISRITHDGGRSFQEFLPPAYNDLHFTACLFTDTGDLFLATPDAPWLVYGFGQGIDERKISPASIASNKIDTAAGGFESAHFLVNTIDGAKLADKSLIGEHFTTHSILSRSIAADTVQSDNIVTEQIDGRIIADGQITWSKIAYKTIDASSRLRENILTAGDFLDFAGIDYENIMTDSVDARLFSTATTEQLLDYNLAQGVLPAEKLIQSSFTGHRLKDQAIQIEHIHPQTIDGFHFKSGSISSFGIELAALSLQRIMPATLTASQLKSEALTAGNLAIYEYWNDNLKEKGIETIDLQDQSFVADLFKSRIFSGEVIKNDSIIYTNIMTESLENEHFVSGEQAIRGEKFIANSISAVKIVTGAISTAALTDGSITEEHIKPGVITSSKIDSQSVSGTHLQAQTLENHHLKTGVFTGEHLQKDTLLASKIKTGVLTDSLFYDLKTKNFADGAFANKGVRFYYQDNSHNWQVQTAHQESRVIRSLDGEISAPTFSPDGSKLAFIANNQFYWADVYLELVVATEWEKYDLAFDCFVWHPDGHGFYGVIKNDSLLEVYFYDIHQGTSDSLFSSSETNAKSLAFSTDLSVIVTLSNSGQLIANLDGDKCDLDDISAMLVVPDGAYIVAYNSNQKRLSSCSTASGVVVTEILSFSLTNLYLNVADNNRFYFTAEQKLYSASYENPTPQYEYDLPTDYAVATVFSAHILQDESIDGALFAQNSITESHLASMSFSSSVFQGAIITNSHLQESSIFAEHIQSDTLEAQQFALQALTAEHFAEKTLSGQYFIETTIPAKAILDGDIRMYHLWAEEPQIQERHLDDLAIGATQVADKNILTTHLLDYLINDKDFIVDSVVSTDSLSDAAISSFHIANRQILTTHILDYSLTAELFAPNSIGAEHLKTAIFTSEHFDSAVIGAEKLIDGALRLGDAYLVTVEDKKLYRYDYDGSNKTLVSDTGKWTAVQRTVRGNNILAIREDEGEDEYNGHLLDILSEKLLSSLPVVTATNQLFDGYLNSSYVIVNGKLCKMDDDGITTDLADNILENGLDSFVSDSTYQLVYVTNDGLTIFDVLDDSTAILFDDTPATAIKSPRFSYNGQQVIFFYNREVYRINSSGGSASPIFTLNDNLGDPISLRPSMEANDDFFLASTNGIYRISDGQETLLTTTTALDSFDIYAYSPFEAATLVEQLEGSAITEAIWASRVLSDANFQAGTIETAKLKPNAFTGDILENNALTSEKLSDTIAGTRIDDEEIISSAIADGSIKTVHIAEESIESRSFAPKNLTSGYISGEIDAKIIKAGVITGDRFQEDTITGEYFAAGIITGDYFSDGTIDSFLVADGNLTLEDFDNPVFAADQVFAAEAIIGAAIAEEQITSGLINSDLTTNLLADGAVISEHIVVDTIDENRIADGAVSSNFFVAADIYAADKIAIGAIFNSNIAGKTLTADLFSANLSNSTITSATLTAGNLQKDSFAITLFEEKIFAGGENGHIELQTLTTAKFAAGAFSADVIVNNAISGESIADKAVTTIKIEPLSFTNTHFADGLFIQRHLDLELAGSRFATSALTIGKFVTHFVNSSNTAPSTLSTEKISGEIVLQDAGLRLSNNTVLGEHFADDIVGEALADNLITSTDLISTTHKISVDTIEDGALKVDLLDKAFLTSEHFVPEAFTDDKVSDDLIPAERLQNNFDSSHIEWIGAEEIADTLSEDKIADKMLLTTHLATGFAVAKISSIEVADIASGALQANNVAAGALKANHISTDDKFTATSFAETELVNVGSLRVSPSLTLAKFATAAETLRQLFGFENADSLHTHKLSEQGVECPTGYNAVGQNGSSFCISSASTGSISYSAGMADAFWPQGGKSVLGYVCTADQLWRAGIATKDRFTAQFTYEQRGLNGALRILKTGSSPGSFTAVDFSDESNMEFYRCF